jgi:hypothetical protein
VRREKRIRAKERRGREKGEKDKSKRIRVREKGEKDNSKRKKRKGERRKG